MPPGMACSLFSLLFQERQFVLQPMYQVSWRFMWERRERLVGWLHSKAHGACYTAPQTLPCQKLCCLHWCGIMQQCAPFLPLSRNILSLNCTCTCSLCACMHACKLLQCALPWQIVVCCLSLLQRHLWKQGRRPSFRLKYICLKVPSKHPCLGSGWHPASAAGRGERASR